MQDKWFALILKGFVPEVESRSGCSGFSLKKGGFWNPKALFASREGKGGEGFRKKEGANRRNR